MAASDRARHYSRSARRCFELDEEFIIAMRPFIIDLELDEYARRVKNNSLHSFVFSKLIRNLSASVESSDISMANKDLILKFFKPLFRADKPPPNVSLIEEQCSNPVLTAPVRDLSKSPSHVDSEHRIDIDDKSTVSLSDVCDQSSASPSSGDNEKESLDDVFQASDSGVSPDVADADLLCTSSPTSASTVSKVVRTKSKTSRSNKKRKASSSSFKSRKAKAKMELIDMPKQVGRVIQIDDDHFLGEESSYEASQECIEERCRTWHLHSSGCVACDYIAKYAFPSMTIQPDGLRFQQLVFFHEHCDDIYVGDLYRRSCRAKKFVDSSDCSSY
jgi:hypothetical protein